MGLQSSIGYQIPGSMTLTQCRISKPITCFLVLELGDDFQNVISGGVCLPPPLVSIVDIAYLAADADCVTYTDKVNSRKQPFSPKSSIAVRLLCYLKNRSELHAICGRQSTPMEGGY